MANLSLICSAVLLGILIKETPATSFNTNESDYEAFSSEITINYSEKVDLFSSRSNSLKIEDCVQKLFHIKDTYFLTTDCCFTKICADVRTIIERNPRIKELLLKLCSEGLQVKEAARGCRVENNPSDINNNINSNNIITNKDSAIGNCSANLHGNTINDRDLDINTEATGDSEKGPTKAICGTSGSSGQSVGNSSAKDGKIRSENASVSSARETRLQFLEIPPGDDMRIHDLRLDEEYLLFEAFSKLMGYLQPAGFPSDTLRDAFIRRSSFHVLTFQLLKIEILLVVWLILWAILSLCLPIGVMVSLCCSNNIRRLNEDFSNASTTSSEKWTGNILGFMLHVLLILLLLPILLILAANEQLSRSISRSPATADIIYEDIDTIFRNTHMQISFVVTSSTDIAIETIKKDLDVAVELLLGRSYQQELSTETGMGTALADLEDLKISTSKVTSLVADLLTECASARMAGSLLQEQLREIARQLTAARQQCSTKDRALCYTLQYSGFDVSFSVDNLTNDMKIKQLERIGTDESINSSIDIARKEFIEIPEQIALESATAISDIKAILNRKRTEVYESTHTLDVMSRSLSETIREGRESFTMVLQKIVTWDLWRWLAILGISSMLSLIWGLLLCGAPCGCGLTRKTIPLLLSGVGLSCIMCIFSWALGALSLLAGGHSDSLICRPLYDHPHYRALGELLDAGGILYGEEGFFRAFIAMNDTVNIAEVLRDCQRDKSAYQTFHLYNEINISKVANYNEWDDLKLLFSNFTIAENSLEVLGPSLKLNLQILSSITAANLTGLRLQLSAPITKRDLSSFADQFNTVARQLTDPVSSRKIDNLAFAARKVVHNEMQKLVEIRNRILYKITILEVLLPPLNGQANQSLSNLKTIQYFLDNHGWQITERARRQFISRIEDYLKDLYNHVNTKITKEIGKCRPLWKIFHSARFYVCKLIMNPMNGMAFSSFLLILLFLTMAPVVIKLVEYYRENNEDILASISHRRSRNGLIIDQEGTWATPPPSVEIPEISLEQIALTTTERPTTSTWINPSPPRPPSTISRRIQSPRLPQIRSLSRAKSPKSKLSSITSRISKARSTTPKNWM